MMNLYNRIMEVVFMVMGIMILIFATYVYVNDIADENLRYYFMAGAMGIILSIFRMLYRKHGPKMDQKPKK